MGEIIVGVDGSEMSKAALQWASAFRDGRGGRVVAISAWQYPAGAATPAGPTVLPEPADVDRRALDALREIVAEVVGEGADGVGTEVGRGPAADVVLTRARRADVDLVVLGTRGLGGFEGLLIGAVTQQCVEHAPCPVVAVRTGPPAVAVPPRRILVGLDGSDGSRRALAWAIDVARTTDAEIVAAHAADVRGSEAAELREFDEWCDPLRDSGVRHSLLVDDGDPRVLLVLAAEEEGVDLVVVGTRGLGAVRSMLLGSVTSHVIRHVARPIAVVPG